jgi:hypothetical protein
MGQHDPGPSVARGVEAFACQAVDLARRDSHAAVDRHRADLPGVDEDGDGLRAADPEATGSFPGGQKAGVGLRRRCV